MNLSMTGELAAAYKSGSQRARVVTEAWGENNLFCPNCSSPKLGRLCHNAKACDFSCPSCGFMYQLKGKKSPLGASIPDGDYQTMKDAILSDSAPSYYFMHYDLATWSIKNLLLIPSFAFPLSAIIKRKPLSATARRAGWVGCNFALNRIPVEARISIVTETKVVSASEVRTQFKKVKPLADLSVKKRGWTLDILNAVRRLGKAEFTTSEAYSFAHELEALHPGNRHVRDKIRQQLQALRDLGLLGHVDRGIWKLK